MFWEEVTIGPCRLIRADCRDVLPTLAGVDALITDPPYGLDLGRANNLTPDRTHLAKQQYPDFEDTYENFVNAVVPALNTAIDTARCAAVFTGPHIHEQRKPMALGGIYNSAGAGRTPWGSKHFLPILFYGMPPKPGQHRPTVLADNQPGEKVAGFPAPKPLKWMRWLIALSTEEGACVLDPFMGSASTGIACLETGRSFVGIEQSARSFALACERMARAAAQLDLFYASTLPTQLSLA